ncbi:MAG: hypothetical protein J6V55_05090 [Alistipes sp.]|nr:hypothetical protein [Alistipes sp.]
MYTIGIDIGPEKTVVSRSPGYGGEKLSQILLKHNQCCLGKEIKTAICRIDNEWSLCPNNVEIECVDVTRNCWREDYLISDRENFKMFIKLLFGTILESDKELMYNPQTGVRNFALGVAYPAYWHSEGHKAPYDYLKFLETECMLPTIDIFYSDSDSRVRALSNSDFFYDLINCSIPWSARRVFCVELGDDIVNFASVPAWVNYKHCWKFDIGAHRVIDTLMAEIRKTGNNIHNLQKLARYNNSTGGNIDIKVLLSSIIKRVVKQYLIEGHERLCISIPFIELLPNWDGPKWETCIEYEVSKEKIDEIIIDYVQLIKDAISYANIRLNQSEWLPERILISGNWGCLLGPYIKSYVDNVFGVDAYIESCPETSISDGLALTPMMYKNPQII